MQQPCLALLCNPSSQPSVNEWESGLGDGLVQQGNGEVEWLPPNLTVGPLKPLLTALFP